MNIKDLLKSIDGRIVGNDDFFSIDGFSGNFTFLDEAHTGDIVIRETVDSCCVEIAFHKNIACLITLNPTDDAIEAAERLNFPLVIIDDMVVVREFVSRYLENKSKEETQGLISNIWERFRGGGSGLSFDEFRERFRTDEEFREKFSFLSNNPEHEVIDFSQNDEVGKLKDLLKEIDGKSYGNNHFFCIDGFTGRFTFLNDAHTGDIVIRHWINEIGVQIAFNKNVACVITENPKGDAIETAERLAFPLVVVDRIELANAYALEHTVKKYASTSTNVVITGTNGKSTTTHLIYHILDNAGYHVLTNTDSESEFNTLIDPMVSKLISDEVIENGELDYLVIEVSEVQGWLGKLMKHHAALMTDAIKPKVGVITNIAMDHIGLVESIDDVFNEIEAVPAAIGDGVCVLNHDDERVLKLDAENPFYTSMSPLNEDNSIYFDGENIIYDSQPILSVDELPFTSNHFIQNILSAIAACISLGIEMDKIVDGVKTYKPLKRRFAKLSDEPLIYDDFAHNPDGIKSTISETLKVLPENQKLHVVCAIRGSRGIEINQLNVDALVESMDDNIELYLTSSQDVVNRLNTVKDEEREVFLNTLNENNIKFSHFDNLEDSLKEVLEKADKNDIILLIGAQGMDPAESILNNIK